MWFIGFVAGKTRDKPTDHSLQGFEYFKCLSGLLEVLHHAGCARDRAGNRVLHMDQYMTLLIMYMLNPICSSLRALQEASDLKKVQRVLGVSRASLGSLSEAVGGLLVEIIGHLVEKLRPVTHDARLSDFDQIITLVDGSWLRALPKMTWALCQNDAHTAVKDGWDENRTELEVLRANRPPVPSVLRSTSMLASGNALESALLMHMSHVGLGEKALGPMAEESGIRERQAVQHTPNAPSSA